MLRAMPVGRDGLLSGNSPFATRSVQSPKFLSPKSGPSRAIARFMMFCACPDEMRQIHMSAEELKALHAKRLGQFLHMRRAHVLGAQPVARLARILDRIDPVTLLLRGRPGCHCPPDPYPFPGIGPRQIFSIEYQYLPG